MWTIVVLKKDNTVEAVPSHWLKNGLCAWPKKDPKKKLERRLKTNTFDFDFYPARILKKNIGKNNCFIICIYCVLFY